MTDDIKELLKTLRGGNISNKLKTEIYTEIKKCVELNKGIEAVEEQDLNIISEDLDNLDDEIRESAWCILNLFKATVGSDIFNKLLKLINDKDVTPQLCSMAKESLIVSLKDYVKTPDFNLEELLGKYQAETETIIVLFTDMCRSLSKTDTADIVYYKVFPCVFCTENEKIRDTAIEIGMSITQFNTLADLDLEKRKVFLSSIENSYILSIRNVLGKLKQSNWHKMFILLLRYGGIVFHQRVDITNAVLKIAEEGFKSSSIDNKLFAFDCWKELINNYGLNIKHMTMSKHIKLLVTPLKANLSSNEAVIYKRFEVWVHLLKKLGVKATVCLEQFLNFCFGPLGANPLVATENPKIASPGKKVVRLCNQSPKFLLEILGHYGHSPNNPCVKCEEELKLEKPILNNSNIESIYTPVIHSIGESCVILYKWDSDAPELYRIIQCMWGSLLNLTKELNSDLKEKIHQVVSNQLLALSKVAEHDNEYLDKVFVPIIKTIMNFECKNTHDRLFKPVVTPSLKYLNSAGKLNTIRLRQSMAVAFSSKRNLIKVRMFGDFCDLIFETEKMALCYPLWTTLGHFAPDLCRTCANNEVFSGYLLSYMLWPVNNYNSIPEDEKQNLINTWKKLIEEICKNCSLVHKNHNNFQTSIVHSFQKIIKKKPLVINSVSVFLPLLPFDSPKTDNLDSLLISDLLQLILDLLDCPLTSKDNVSKLAALLTICINDVLRHPNEKADLIYEKLFKAIQYFLQPHQMYSVLDKLEKILSECYTCKETVPHALKSLITDLTLHKDSEISKTAMKILSLLENINKDDTLKSNSENVIENSNSLLSLEKKKAHKFTKPTFVENTRVIQQLLEQNTPSPVKLKGSQLKNSPKSSNKNNRPSSSSSVSKSKKSSHTDDKETYELIETNYKFNKRKLTEHQKEKMKKRREDIPALYQDLSQSQTDSTSNSQSNSQDDKGLKVIVEKIPSLDDDLDFVKRLNNNFNVPKITENDDIQYENNKIEEKSKRDVLPPPVISNEDIFAGINSKEEPTESAKTEDEQGQVFDRKKRIMRELLRLKMNVVGGDVNIDLNENRKSRRSTRSLDNSNCSPLVLTVSEEPSKEVKRKPRKISKDGEKVKRKYVRTNDKKGAPRKRNKRKRSQSLTNSNPETIEDNLKLTSTENCNDNCSLEDQNLNHCSEDIIESSQESYVSLGKSLSRTSSNLNQVAENITDDVLQPVTEIRHSDNEIGQVLEEETPDLPAIQNINVDTNRKSEGIEQQGTNTIVLSEDFSPDKLIRKDLDQMESKLTKRELEICEASTESPPVDVEDDFQTCPETLESSTTHKIEKQVEELVGCKEAENVTIEVEKTPSLFDSEADDQKSCESNQQKLTEESTAENKTKTGPQQQQPTSRSARLVGLVTAAKNPVGKKSPHRNPFFKNKSDCVSPKTSCTLFSQKTSRIRKLMQNCEDQKPLAVIDVDEEIKDTIPENELLQFDREVPSPLATPKGSILKRKRELNDCSTDDNHQSAKRKRVNFSDPPTTCKKVFIQHEGELIYRHRGIKKNLLLTTKLPTKERDINTVDENGHIIDVKEENPKVIMNQDVPSEPLSQEIVDLDVTEECNKIDCNNTNIDFSQCLDDAVPVYPDLIDCLENVDIISDQLSSSLCKSELLEELNKKNIVTVRDLALLTEKKIHSLSLEPPKMAEVKRALLDFVKAKKGEDVIEDALLDTDDQEEKIEDVSGEIKDALLDSDDQEETISPANLVVLEESDLNTTNVLINGEQNELQSRDLKVDSQSDECGSAKSPEKRITILDNIILQTSHLDVEQQSTNNQNQTDDLESQEEIKSSLDDSIENHESSSIIKENFSEPLENSKLVSFDKVESFVKETPVLGTYEKLESTVVDAIDKLSESHDSHSVLKRLMETIFDKMSPSEAWNMSHEYLTKRVFKH